MTADETTTSTDLRQVMRRDGDLWTIIFAGRRCHLHDTRGLGYLAYLLARSHDRVAALELAASTRGAVEMATDPRDPAVARERARVNVTRGVSAALRRLEQHLPELAHHLRATLRTGGHCVYSPDPRLPGRWET